MLFRELGDTAEQVQHILDTQGAAVREAAEACRDAHSALFVGRGMGAAIACEGALKLKEISYLHAEAYAAGEMKHGPIALIDPGFPVIAVATKSPTYDKSRAQPHGVSRPAGRASSRWRPRATRTSRRSPTT